MSGDPDQTPRYAASDPGLHCCLCPKKGCQAYMGKGTICDVKFKNEGLNNLIPIFVCD